jgi:transposase-like protein
MTVSLVARRHGVAPNQLFTWRRLVAQGGLTAAGSGEEVVPASDYRALQNQVRELHPLLGKKTLEAEILKEALEHATGSNVAAEGRFPMKTVAEVIGVSRSNLIERCRNDQRRGSVGHRCQTTSSWPRSRRSSPTADLRLPASSS